ncbi:endonuclease VII domain-containing protein [Mycobacterium colombiense]
MKTCAQCGSSFVPHRRTTNRQKYCSSACGKRASHVRLRPPKGFDPERECLHCGITFVVQHALHRYCSRFCRGAAARDKVPQRWRHAKSRYGLSQADVEAKLTAQEGCCAICGTELAGAGLDRDAPQLDHCHETGSPRGILCRLCNTALGNLRDDPELVEKALDYLRLWQRASIAG